MSASFSRLATVTASTKRATMVAGKKGAPMTYIASLKCTPLDPVSAEIQQRMQLKTPHEVLQSFVDGPLDIVEGDVLVVGTKEYPIKSVAEWTFDPSTDSGQGKFLHLVVEDLKR